MTTATATMIPLKESFSVDPTQLREGKDGSFIKELPDGRYRVRCKGQHCGIVNRNNRIYPAESTWGRHTRTESEFMRRVKARRVTGQLEHPPDGKSSMPLAAVVITEVSAPDDKGVVMVTFETMSTDAGRVVEAYIRDGVGFGLSSRGNGSVRRNADGIDEVQGDFEPITFDCVVDESTPGAEVASRMLREARQRLMESAGNDAERARVLADRQVDEAIRRDMLSLRRAVAVAETVNEMHGAHGSPPTGDNEYLLGLDDGAGHYRGYLNGHNQWDVWLMIHNLAPEKIAENMPTVRDAKNAAESHAAKIMRESFTVDTSMPYAGTMLVMRFDSESEAKQALSTLERAGFSAHRKGDDSVCVYTSYEDPAQAEAHITRVLNDKNIEPRDEAFGRISGGRIVWEDNMAGDNTELLNEIRGLRAQLGLNERGMTYEMDDEEIVGLGMDEMGDYDDEMMPDVFGFDEMGDPYDGPGMYYEQDDEDEPEDDEEDDDEDEEDDEMEEAGDAMYDDPDVMIDGSPEDELDADRMPEGAVRFVDYPRKHLGETVGLTRVYLDKSDSIVEVAQLTERPANRAAQKAMFAKAFGRSGDAARKARSTKGGKKYYRKFRREYAKDKGLKVGAAATPKGGPARRVKKGKKKRNEARETVHRREDDERQQLTERPAKRSAEKAMFAKAFARSGDAARKARSSKGGKKYYRKFRREYAKDKGLKVGAAATPKGGPARRVKKGKRKKNESTPNLAQLVEAVVTLLESPYEGDVMTGLRMVMEVAADWPEDAQLAVLESMQTLYGELADDGIAAVVESAAEHLLGEPLVEDEDAEDEGEAIDEDAEEDEGVEDIAEGDGDGETAALRAENARLTELVNALTELNAAQAVESKVDVLCLEHPALKRVRDKLEECRTVEEVVAEANTYLSLLGESRENTPANGQGGSAPALTMHAGGAPNPTPAGFGSTSVPSNGNGGSLSGPLEEGIKPPLGGKKKLVEATSSRVAAYRRRQANRRG